MNVLNRGVRRFLHVGQDTFYRGLAALRIACPVAVVSRPCGFFGNYFITLNGIRFLNSLGLEAVPWWGASCLYFDDSTAPNVWARFFSATEPGRAAGPGGPPALKYRASAMGMTAYRAPTPRLAASALMRRFAAPRPSFQMDCDRFIAEAFGGRPAIGVHVRGTDAGRGLEDRTCIDMDLVDEEIRGSLSRYPDAVIFLATDEDDILGRFRRRYGDRLRYRDGIRSPDQRSIHGHYDAGMPGSGFTKGRDVLVDALVLSRCQFLIRSHSAVTTFALCWNPSLPYVDLECRYLGAPSQPWLHEVPSAAVGGAGSVHQLDPCPSGRSRQ